MTDTGKSFWQTVPGIITAVAGLVTAVGGLLGILFQNGVLGGGSNERPPAVAQSSDAGDRPAAAETRTAEPSTPIPWANATATLVRKDQTSATVKAPTVGLACTTDMLSFKNGQHLRLDLVRTIQFDAIYTENASADGVVTLLDGRELKDPIHTWNCPITGRNELGPVVIQLDDIKRIDFHR